MLGLEGGGALSESSGTEMKSVRRPTVRFGPDTDTNGSAVIDLDAVANQQKEIEASDVHAEFAGVTAEAATTEHGQNGQIDEDDGHSSTGMGARRGSANDLETALFNAVGNSESGEITFDIFFSLLKDNEMTHNITEVCPRHIVNCSQLMFIFQDTTSMSYVYSRCGRFSLS